ncbi:unnamed protein product [Vitrella brassicaformis CCMP3155]|uniref:Uncharacterized protein n=1 Tax=Vitrella brassicaformis (strain CCMP3155) TaxID=1169540 RepID=A0A0G4FJ08_VITBC|nr:unnamed protein product [Vitrella brassicaformis CCMP3155]|eukprot:CEM13749.1 unnamed protein product [Vitrella brassicaformis CCMP3155]
MKAKRRIGVSFIERVRRTSRESVGSLGNAVYDALNISAAVEAVETTVDHYLSVLHDEKKNSRAGKAGTMEEGLADSHRHIHRVKLSDADAVREISFCEATGLSNYVSWASMSVIGVFCALHALGEQLERHFADFFDSMGFMGYADMEDYVHKLLSTEDYVFIATTRKESRRRLAKLSVEHQSRRFTSLHHQRTSGLTDKSPMESSDVSKIPPRPLA